MDVTPAQFIDRIAVELDERGWTKGVTQDGDGCVCLYGAVHRAVDFYRDAGTFDGKATGVPSYWEDWEVAGAAVMSIWETAWQRTKPIALAHRVHNPEAIVFFNDAIAKSVEDVKALLEVAKKRLQS